MEQYRKQALEILALEEMLNRTRLLPAPKCWYSEADLQEEYNLNNN